MPIKRKRISRAQPLTLDAALLDPNLLGAAENFADASWWPWRVWGKAAFGLKMNRAERQFFEQCTGRNTPPKGPVSEAWTIVGRRGGKSRFTAAVATYLGALCDWTPYVAPGEVPCVLTLATNMNQARVILGCIKAFLQDSPVLSDEIAGGDKWSVTLRSGLEIRTAPPSFRTTRGYTVVACLLDEIGFWLTDEAVQSDAEIVAALRPTMASVPGSMLLALSSPDTERGELYRNYRDGWGNPDDDRLVWRAPTWAMNPRMPRTAPKIKREYERDPVRAASEYGAQFRKAEEKFFDADAVRAAVPRGVRERGREASTTYVAFVDPSGGRSDRFTLAIAHVTAEGRRVLDVLRARKPPFDPNNVVRDFAELCKRYGVTTVRGDQYGGAWVESRFQAHGLQYKPSKYTRSAIYKLVFTHT